MQRGRPGFETQGGLPRRSDSGGPFSPLNGDRSQLPPEVPADPVRLELAGSSTWPVLSDARDPCHRPHAPIEGMMARRADRALCHQ